VIDPKSVFASLRAGNDRFVASKPIERDFGAERAAGGQAHEPVVVALTCSDARVPLELVFDQPIGTVFVVRNAGHVATPAGLASVRFALEVLGARAVLVLGHEGCGAVQAAVAGDAPEWLDPVLDDVRASLATCPGCSVDEAILTHVRATADDVRELITALPGDAAATEVAGAVYRLATGHVDWLDK
jgi:carbonic anhydrase